MINFLKGIIVGMGAITPGLSGSILLIIFKLYEKTIEAIGSLFQNFKKNVLFLIPLLSGFAVGMLIFGRVVDYLLTNYEMYTRFTFLGLVLGTVPLFYREVKKKGFQNKYYMIMAAAAVLGLALFFFNSNLFPVITNPNIAQSVVLGFAVAGSSIVPGIDGVVILSALGLYEAYIGAIADVNIPVLLPAALGLVVGALIISYFVNKLLKRHYTVIFSAVFGLFLSIIPSVLSERCRLAFDLPSFLSLLLFLAGLAASYFWGKMKG